MCMVKRTKRNNDENVYEGKPQFIIFKDGHQNLPNINRTAKNRRVDCQQAC